MREVRSFSNNLMHTATMAPRHCIVQREVADYVKEVRQKEDQRVDVLSPKNESEGLVSLSAESLVENTSIRTATFVSENVFTAQMQNIMYNLA